MVSIIIPVHNGEKYISRCLDSIINQTYTDIEIIVVDNNSSDRTSEIVKKYMVLDKRIVLVIEPLKGVSAARNTGLRRSNSQYIGFVDADDYVEPTMVSSMMSCIEGTDLIVCKFDAESSDGEKDYQTLPNLFQDYTILSKSSLIADYLCGTLGQQISFSVCNKLFRSELIKENRLLFNPTVSIGEDMIFVLSYILHCNRIHVVNSYLYHYCTNNGSTMNNKDTDYCRHYDHTYNVLKNQLDYGRSEIEISKALQIWALEALVVVLNSPAVRDMSMKLFCSYYAEHLITSTLLSDASKCKFVDVVGFKRKILLLIINRPRPLALYILMRLNLSLNRRW